MSRGSGGSRTASATAVQASTASAADAQKPARQPCHSTSSASGLAESSIPVLPKAWMIPDHSAKRAKGRMRAAKVIGHISIPEQPTPSTACASTMPAAPPASAASTAPTAPTASSASAVRRTP